MKNSNKKVYCKKKKDGTWETEKEMMKQVELMLIREEEQYKRKEYDSNIKRIMKKGFSREQAKYLRELELSIRDAYYHKSLHDRVFQMKSDEMNQEELQAEIYAKAEHLCKSCAHHDFDCNTFIKTTSTIVLPEWKIVECSGYK